MSREKLIAHDIAQYWDKGKEKIRKWIKKMIYLELKNNSGAQILNFKVKGKYVPIFRALIILFSYRTFASHDNNHSKRSTYESQNLKKVMQICLSKQRK